MEEDFSQKNGLKTPAGEDKQERVSEPLLHKINLDDLKKETGFSTVEEIGAFVGLSNPKGAYNWDKDKEDHGTRPKYNAIIRLLQKGATQKTLFGVEPKQPNPEKNKPKEPIDYKDPQFLETVQNAMAYIEECKKRGIK